MRNEKRVNLAFSLLEYITIKAAADAARARVGTFCRETVINAVGKIRPEMPEKGIAQLNLFDRKPRGKRLTISNKKRGSK